MTVGAVVFDLFNTLTAPVDDGVFRASVRAVGDAAGVDPDGFTKGWFELGRKRFDGTFATSEAECSRGVRGDGGCGRRGGDWPGGGGSD